MDHTRRRGSGSDHQACEGILEKHGVQDVRLGKIHTGPHTGQFVVEMVYADMSAYATVQAAGNADPEFQKIIAQIRQDGSLIQEREILIGMDLS